MTDVRFEATLNPIGQEGPRVLAFEVPGYRYDQIAAELSNGGALVAEDDNGDEWIIPATSIAHIRKPKAETTTW